MSINKMRLYMPIQPTRIKERTDVEGTEIS